MAFAAVHIVDQQVISPSAAGGFVEPKHQCVEVSPSRRTRQTRDSLGE